MYKWIFRKSYTKHLREDGFLLRLGLYTKHVQSKSYAKNTRTAMLWSATSALYLGWELDVQGSSTLTFSDLQFGPITQEKILWLLFILTCYYTIRILFSVAKAFSFINPFFVCRPLYCRKKMQKSGVLMSVAETTLLDIKLCYWLDKLANQRQYAFDASQHPSSENRNPKIPGKMQYEDQVRFMVRYPTLGLLENFFFPVIVAPGWCVFVLVWLAKEIWCY